MNITQAGLGRQEWVEDTLQYWDADYGAFMYIDSYGDEGKNFISSSEGIWIKSLKDNITLVREN